MKINFTFLILFVLVLILGITLVSSVVEDQSDDNIVNLTVYSSEPRPLFDVTSEIRNAGYYEEFDNETLEWMESLGSKSVFMGDGQIVIMNSYNANKVPIKYVTDVQILDDISCNLIENRSLGNNKYPTDVLYVDHVEFLGEQVIDLGLA